MEQHWKQTQQDWAIAEGDTDMAAAPADAPAATNMAEAPAVLAAVTAAVAAPAAATDASEADGVAVGILNMTVEPAVFAAATDAVAVGILNMTAEPAVAAAATDAVAVGILNMTAAPGVAAAATDAIAAPGGHLIGQPAHPATGKPSLMAFGVPKEVATEAQAAMWAIRTINARRHESGAASGSTGSHETLETAMQPALEGDEHMSAPPAAATAAPEGGGVVGDAAGDVVMVDLSIDSDSEGHKPDGEMPQQQEEQQDASDQSVAQQLTLPNWKSLPQAETALRAAQSALGCPWERMRLLRTGMLCLQQLPAGDPVLHSFSANYEWLQKCLKHKEEAGAMEEFAKGLDLLVDSLQYSV
jgi:hypothetical protein